MKSAALHPAGALGARVERLTRVCDLGAREWDTLIPRDVPHLRWGFLHAVECSGLGRAPHYLCARRGGRLVGVLVAYTLPVDVFTLAPKRYTAWFSALRDRYAPRLLFLKGVTAGPLVTNCCHNFHLSESLTADERQRVIGDLVDALEAIPGTGGLTTLFDFPEDDAAEFAPALRSRGFLQGSSLPGTRLDVTWQSLDGYMGQVRKAFRRTVVKDRAAAAGLVFDIIDDYSEIAEEAWALYRNVIAKADNLLIQLTPAFFGELGRFEQSRLVTARDAETGRLVGVEFLLVGDTLVQDLCTGLDYADNAARRLYFNLLYPVIGFAGSHGFERLYLGQTSYTFKARLGVTHYPSYVFVKHSNPFVQKVVTLLQGVLFPKTTPITYRVFRDATG